MLEVLISADVEQYFSPAHGLYIRSVHMELLRNIAVY